MEVVELEASPRSTSASAGVIRVGVARDDPPSTDGLGGFDILLAASPGAPRPWVSALDVDAEVERLEGVVARQPVAASVAAQVLRTTLSLTFEQSLALESIAYSMLLASAGFRAWRAATPPRRRPEPEAPRVLVDLQDRILQVRLNRPARRNAVDAAMRDALAEALAFALDHPDAPPVALAGEGPAFSAGGDLDEFGTADDPGWAHMVRVLRSPAALAYALGTRLTARLHGACVGAGIEVPAAAARVVASRDAVFRLPEVSMGLIPGAGGTASIPRRIGRRRACWMAISGGEVDAPMALAWGLVDEIAA